MNYRKDRQTEILELKNITTGLKNSIRSFNIRLSAAEKKTRELENRLFEIIQSEEQKKNEKE